MSLRTERARPMSLEERRDTIIAAATPLVVAHGRDVSTRLIAQDAGIAEGTIFRAFGDKESLLAAVVERFMDPQPVAEALASIDSGLPLEQKIHDILFHLRARMTGVIGMMSAMGMTGRPPVTAPQVQLSAGVADVLSQELDRMRIDPRSAAYLLRMVAFASSVETFTTDLPFSTDQLADFVTYGIAERESSSA